ncbi:methyltransferase domain-containing protein [Bdellovibrionota bacterium FG-1]
MTPLAQSNPLPTHAKQPPLWAEMRALGALGELEHPTPSLEVSLLIPARGAADSLAETVSVASRFLTHTFGDSFEIILIPNPPVYQKPGSQPDRSIEVSQELARKFDHVRVSIHRLPQGKGAALRTGFKSSRGRLVFFTDADLPYDLDFFDVAARELREGADLVTGNRRLKTSIFDIPVGLLPLAYKRHRLGLAFNRVVQWLFPIHTTDTQAGLKAMSRRLACAGFERQVCPGFFFDLEFFLAAAGLGYRHMELPVVLHLNSEKSTVRVIRESILAAFWLTRITFRNVFKKAYGPGLISFRPSQILSRYPKTPLGTRFFLEARWRLTPYLKMAAHLPSQGVVLDLGCGHGLFSLALALNAPNRTVLGLDHDADRIHLAQNAGQAVTNLNYSQGTLSDPGQTGIGVKPGSVAGISMIDVMHYFPYAEQERLFTQAFDLLEPGGTLIVREVNPEQGATSTFNRAYEKLATATGFTRSEKKTELQFRSQNQWEGSLRKKGFSVQSRKCSHFLFADILYICRKPHLT